MFYWSFARLVGLLLMIGLLVPPSSVRARQQNSKQGVTFTQAGYFERATSLAIRTGEEAAKLSLKTERIKTRLAAANLLVRMHPEDAARLLDVAWEDAKDCDDNDHSAAAQIQMQKVLALRVEVLTLYAKLNSQQAEKLAKTEVACKKTDGDTEGSAENGPARIGGRRSADALVEIGLARLSASPTEAVNVALSSISSTGHVSEELAGFLKALKESGNEPLKRGFEEQLAGALSKQVSLEPFDHRAVAGLLAADPAMPPPIRVALVGYLLRSLQSAVNAIHEAQITKQPLRLEPDLLGYLYTTYLRSIRPSLERTAPDKLISLNALLNEIAAVLPLSWQERAYEAFTTDSAEQQLTRARDTDDKKLRDARLLSFAFRALAGKLPGLKGRQLTLAASAIDLLDNAEAKAVMNDYLLMAGVENKLAEKNFTAAWEKAAAVSKLDWRAWTLMAVGSVLPVQQQSDAVQMFEGAARALDKSPPTPRRAALAFQLAELWSRRDQLRAFEVLAAAAKYANQAEIPPPSPSFDGLDLGGFYSHIGEFLFAPGQEPKSLSEIDFGPGIERLAQEDWDGVEQYAALLKDTDLRLRFQLVVCKGILQPSEPVKAATIN